jgi:hypothetical protein
VRLALNLRGIDAATRRFEVELFRQLDAAVSLISRRVADDARAGHPYQNRSGDLEAATRPVDTYVSAHDGQVIGGVVADTDYAQYVNAMPGFQFLEPAYERIEPEADALLAQALEFAAQAAGLG